MSLGIVPSDAVLLAVQAGLVAGPRAMPPSFTTKLRRFRGRGWAAIPVVSIIGVIVMIRYASGTATWLTWLALIAVPILAFMALAWMIHGHWSWWRTLAAALVTAGLFLVAWRNQSLTPEWLFYLSKHGHHLPGVGIGTIKGWHYSLAGITYARAWHLPAQLAATLLCGLSCITLGALLASVTPLGWLKAGVVLMSCADVWLIATNLLQTPNNELVDAVPAPGSGLPQLQSETFGSMNMGYGDFFVAGVLGGALAAGRASARVGAGVGTASVRAGALISFGRIQLGKRLGAYRGQLGAALMVFVLAALFDLLFVVVDELPATVPVAATVIIMTVWKWVDKRRKIERSRPPSAASTAQTALTEETVAVPRP